MKKFVFASTIILFLINNIVFAQITDSQPKMSKPTLKTFFETHLFYPEQELKNNIQGKVVVNFLVDKDGNVLSYKIGESINKNLDTEAIRLFRMVEFNPAYKYGIPVAGKGNFAVDFKSKKHSKLLKRRVYSRLENYTPFDTSYIIFSKKQVDTISKADIEGGEKNLYNYIYSRMKYPPQALKLSIQGEVILDFVVETNGLMSNITINQAVGGGCTEEAIRICKDIRWKPAWKDGEAVRSRNQLKIRFRINADGRPDFVPNQNNSGM